MRLTIMKTSDVFDKLFAFLDTVSDETLKEEFASLEKFNTGVHVSEYFAFIDSCLMGMCENVNVTFRTIDYNEHNANENTLSLAA